MAGEGTNNPGTSLNGTKGGTKSNEEKGTDGKAVEQRTIVRPTRAEDRVQVVAKDLINALEKGHLGTKWLPVNRNVLAAVVLSLLKNREPVLTPKEIEEILQVLDNQEW